MLDAPIRQKLYTGIQGNLVAASLDFLVTFINKQLGYTPSLLYFIMLPGCIGLHKKNFRK